MNNYVLVKIEGKHVTNYLKWLIKNRIKIIKLTKIKYNELNIIIDYKDYDILSKYSKTYKITIIKRYGWQKIKSILINNNIIISCIIVSIIFVYILSTYIFSIDIISNDKEMITHLKKELSKYEIATFKKKKDYAYIKTVKNKILEDNHDIIEWLEIEEKGTKYIVRFVERKMPYKRKEYKYQSITANKDATIVSIKALSGDKIKKTNEYVKKDDTIISGLLLTTDGTTLYTKATGYVLGEVWYKVSVEYPLYYQEEKLTGKSINVLSIYFLNKEIPFFSYKKYKQFHTKSKTIIKSNVIPLIIAKEKLYEVVIKEDIYTNEEAASKGIEEAKAKMKLKNNNIIEIKDVVILDKENQNSKVKLTLFISAIEDITKIVELKEETVEN